jgi:hypothetical protein
MIDMGVANPRAQGQAMINTATALIKPYTQLGSGPQSPHPKKVRMAMLMTAATK